MSDPRPSLRVVEFQLLRARRDVLEAHIRELKKELEEVLKEMHEVQREGVFR